MEDDLGAIAEAGDGEVHDGIGDALTEHMQVGDDKMFTRKHYVEIAKVLCQAHKTQPECDDTVFYITANLANMFKKDNPKFDLDKFERASRCAVAKAGRKSRSGLRLFGAGEAYRPASGATVITSEGVYRRRRRR